VSPIQLILLEKPYESIIAAHNNNN